MSLLCREELVAPSVCASTVSSGGTFSITSEGVTFLPFSLDSRTVD